MNTKTALHACLIFTAPSILSGHASAAAPDIVEGGWRLYHMSCAMCHGAGWP